MIENTHRFGQREVSARRHDGTDESAIALAAWVNTDKGKAEAFLTGDYPTDETAAYIELMNLEKHIKYIVRPGFWIVRTEAGHFFTTYPEIFKEYYKPLEIIEVPS